MNTNTVQGSSKSITLFCPAARIFALSAVKKKKNDIQRQVCELSILRKYLVEQKGTTGLWKNLSFGIVLRSLQVRLFSPSYVPWQVFVK